MCSETDVHNVSIGGKLPQLISRLDAKTGRKTRNLIVAPIVIDGSIHGTIFATNRVSAGEELFGCRSSSSTVSKEKGFLPPFGPEDEILLGFLAVNAGLAIKYTMQRSKSTVGCRPSLRSAVKPIKIKSLPDVDSAMQQLVDAACADLDADLISVFAYNDSTKTLECTVSKDIKGLSIPIDRGIAGTSFRMGRVINVKEIASDERHNNDVDAQVGYKTQTLLCAPIMDSSGRPVGVMQALNKKGTSHFSRQDETMICEFCVQVSSLLQDADYLRDCSDNSDAVLLTKFLSALSTCSSVAELVSESRRLVAASVACDFVGVYTYVPTSDGVGNYLMSEDPLIANSMEAAYGNKGRIRVNDVPCEIVDALRTGMITELSVSKANKLSSKLSYKNAHENFLPGISARHALIIPIDPKVGSNTFALCKENGKDDADDLDKVMCSERVLVVVKSSQSLLPLSSAAKDILNLFVAVLDSSLKSVDQKERGEAVMASMESSCLLATSTLSAVTDYILVLNKSGKVVSCTGDLKALLGNNAELPDEEDEGEEVHRHFSRWFKRSGCASMVADITAAVEAMPCTATSSTKSTVLTHTGCSEGVHVEYQLLSFDISGASDGRDARLVLVIHRRCALKVKVPLLYGGDQHSIISNSTRHKHKVESHNLLENNDSALATVDAAAGLLKSLSEKWTVPLHVMSNIRDITKSLDQLSSKLPPSSHCKKTENSSQYQCETGEYKEQIVCLVDPDMEVPSDLFSWEFDVLQIESKAGLVNALGLLFKSMNILDALDIDHVTLANYIRDVSCKYHDDNPFHNLHHATYVTQFASMLIHATEAKRYLSAKQLFGVLLSAVVHDVDHPGNTNMFEINSQSYLALLYNDQSVLENHHCSTAFQLMKRPASNVFANLDKSTSCELRKIIVSCVMATDMSVHFELVEETKKIFSGGDLSFSDSQDQIFLCKLLLHSADLSNPVRPFHISQAWARRISAEFNLQISREQELGMPVLNFMMTPDDKALCKNETGFASFVVAPMWRSLSSLFPGLLPLVKQLDSNLASWKNTLEKIVKEEEMGKSMSGKH